MKTAANPVPAEPVARLRSRPLILDVVELAALAFVVLTLAGCSAVGEDGVEVCAPRTGQYLATLTEVSGTCGPIGTEGLDADAPPDPSCSGVSVRDRGDACSTSVSVTCVAGDDGTTLTEAGVITWSADGDAGSGTLVIATQRAGVELCRSTYRVEIRRPS